MLCTDVFKSLTGAAHLKECLPLPIDVGVSRLEDIVRRGESVSSTWAPEDEEVRVYVCS